MCGAGDRDRTGIACLEGRNSTIELHPQKGLRTCPVVGEAGLEPAASCSQSRHATNCATPRRRSRERTATWTTDTLLRPLKASLPLADAPVVNDSTGSPEEHHDVEAVQGEALWELLCDVSSDVSGPTDERLRSHVSEALSRWVGIQGAAAVALVRKSSPRNLLVAGWQRRDLPGDILVGLTEAEFEPATEANFTLVAPHSNGGQIAPTKGRYEIPVGAGRVALRAYVDQRPPEEHDAVHRLFAELIAGALHRSGLEERLRVTAMKDPVTGLANRRLLVDHLERRLAAMERRTYEQLIIVAIEVHLAIPGRENHPSTSALSAIDPDIADEVELVVSRRLRAAARRSDLVSVVAPHVFVAAIELAPGDDMMVPIERLRRAVCEPVAVRSTTLPVHIRFGIAEALPGDDPVTLLQRAEAARTAHGFEHGLN